jgi:mono/diheme cytochrome c family protein
VAGLTLVAVAGSRFGADGGGLLVLLAGYATMLVRSRGIRIDAKRATAIAVAAVVAGVALVGLDAAIGGSSHVTQAVADGPRAILADIADRLELSARRTFGAFGPTFAVVASLVVLVVVASRRPRRPMTDAVLVALLVSLVVNDTPGDVVGFGAVAAFVVRRFEEGCARNAPTHLVRLRAMRRPLTALSLLLAALAFVVAGCGGGEVEAAPETVVGSIPEQTTTGAGEDLPALALEGDAAAGKTVFASAGCVACHTLSAAGSKGTVGPNLDQAKPSYELAVQRVTLGRGGMPSFKGQLEPQQIADVAQFVASSAGG